MAPSLVLIPDGRSLQKKKADYSDPRLLPILSEDIFVGFAHRAGQAEILAWNPTKGRYEFFVVSGLGDKKRKPELLRPSRALCLSCHQGGGPIFSKAPWSETNAGFEAAVGQAKSVQNRLKKEMVAHSRLPLSGFSGVAAYDAMVRAGNERLRTRKICEEFCSGTACRKRLLKASVRAGRLAPGPKKGSDLDLNVPEIREFLGSDWPKILENGYAHTSSVIPDRDPTFGDAGRSLIPLAAQSRIGLAGSGSFSPEEALYADHLAGLSLNEFTPFRRDRAGGGGVKEISGIKEEADPLHPRPAFPIPLSARTLKAGFFFLDRAASACFGLDRERAKKIKDLGRLEEASIAAAVESHWPPQGEELVGMLNESGSQLSSGRGGAPDPSAKPEANAQGLLRKSCAECHQGEIAGMLGSPLLPLESLVSLARYKNGLALEVLANKKMPPAQASYLLSEEERAVLIHALEEAESSF